MTDAPASGSTRAQDVAARLRRDIMSGATAPGARLRQAQVAAELGVSTTPVREAFATLVQEGLAVKDGSHRGVLVFRPSLTEFRELYEIRMNLEPLAVVLALPNLSDAHIAAIAAIAAACAASTDPKEREVLNRRFHETIYSYAGRARLAALIEQLRDASSVYLRYRTFAPAEFGHWKEADEEHTAIIDALRRRDAHGAGPLVRLHLEHSLEYVEAALHAAGALD